MTSTKNFKIRSNFLENGFFQKEGYVLLSGESEIAAAKGTGMASLIHDNAQNGQHGRRDRERYGIALCQGMEQQAIYEEQIREVYNFDVPHSTISRITDKVIGRYR